MDAPTPSPPSELHALILPPTYLRPMAALDRTLLHFAERTGSSDLLFRVSPAIEIAGTEHSFAALQPCAGEPFPDLWALHLSHIRRGVASVGFSAAHGMGHVMVAKEGARAHACAIAAMTFDRFEAEVATALGLLVGPLGAPVGWLAPWWARSVAAMQERTARFHGAACGGTPFPGGYAWSVIKDPGFAHSRARQRAHTARPALRAALAAYEDADKGSQGARTDAARAFLRQVEALLGSDPGPDEVESFIVGDGEPSARVATLVLGAYRAALDAV